jgi:hypothetical protein
MDYLNRGQTFGFVISARRKERFLTQGALLRSDPTLGRLLDLRLLNELEQDRIDPRTLQHFTRILESLAKSLGLDLKDLQALAHDHDRAAAFQRHYQQRLEQEAIAFRARTVRG